MYRSILFLFVMSLSIYANDVSAKIETLAIQITEGLKPSNQKQNIAILPFSSTDESGKYIAEYLITLFQKDNRFSIVDRSNLNKVMSEQAFSLSGATEEGVLEIGKLSAAKYILSGKVSEAFGKKLISAVITDVETAEILSSAKIQVAGGDLSNLQKELFSEKGDISAVMFRSAFIPGWGQLYANKNIRGGFI